MSMNRRHHALDGCLGFHRRYGFGDQLESLRPDDMNAENFAILLLRDNFHEPLVLVKNGRFAVSGERKLAHLHFEPLRARLGFREADATYSRIGIRRAWNTISIDWAHRPTCNISNRDHALSRRDMRK